MSAKAKIKQLEEQIYNLQRAIAKTAEQIIDTAKDMFGTDNIVFKSEEHYDDNNYFTIVSVESINGIWIDYNDLSDRSELLAKIARGELTQEQIGAEDLDEDSLEFAELCKKRNISFEDALECVESLNGIPEDYAKEYIK